jgi:hypothetical protein
VNAPRTGAIIVLVIGAAAGSGACATAANVTIVDMIPKAASWEEWNDSEPSIAVNSRDPRKIAVSAFTPSLVARLPHAKTLGDLITTVPTAPLFISIDNGISWALADMLPAGGPITRDITVRFSPRTGALFASMLRYDSSLSIARSRNPSSYGIMETLLSFDVHRGDDQPYIEVAPASATSDYLLLSSNVDEIYQPQSAQFYRFLDIGGAALRMTEPTHLDVREERVGDGPSIRAAVASDGKVYEAFFSWRSATKVPGADVSNVRADLVVLRDDLLGGEDPPFARLVEPSDHRRGIWAATNIPIAFKDVLGNQRIGSSLSIAVDPNHSDRVFVAWSDGDAKAYHLHVKRSDSAGEHWLALALPAVVRGTNPSIAVNASGVVALLFQHFTDARTWESRVLLSHDGTFANPTEIVLSNARALDSVDVPLLGDYDQIQAVGNDFYGVFAANNEPVCANFPLGATYRRYADFGAHRLYDRNSVGRQTVGPSVDPFFFHITNVMETGIDTSSVRCASPKS